MSTEERVRALSPLRFQALALLLLRRELSDSYEDVRDTAGEGNGCDGVLVLADHVEAFQVRTVEREFGDTQKRKAREAVDLALETIPKERGLPLTSYMFVFNLDLQPSEAKWFADQRVKYAALGCAVTYRTLGWIVSALLDDKHAGVRREFVESEFDRQGEILKALAVGGQSSQDALRRILELIQGVALGDDAKRALETLLERARFHFEAGMESLAEESFRTAVTALSEARALLKRHQDDPLYVDVVYWLGVAMQFANDWKGALMAFEEADALYRGVGRLDEARYARGNRGHALRGLAQPQQALAVFREVNAEWLATSDTFNILTGHLNEAEIHMDLGDFPAAGRAFSAAKAVVTTLSAPDIVFLGLFDVVLHFFGSYSTFYYAMEDDVAALACLETGIAFARSGGRKHILAKFLSGTVSPLAFEGRLAEAVANGLEAEILLLEIGDEHSLGSLYNNLGVAYGICDQLDKASAYLAKDYELCRKLGNTAGAQKTVETMKRFGCRLPELET